MLPTYLVISRQPTGCVLNLCGRILRNRSRFLGLCTGDYCSVGGSVPEMLTFRTCYYGNRTNLASFNSMHLRPFTSVNTKQFGPVTNSEHLRPITSQDSEHSMPVSPVRNLAGDMIFMNVDLDMDTVFKDIESLEENVRRRCMTLDVRQMRVEYDRLRCLLKERLELERLRAETSDIMKLLVKEKQRDSYEAEQLIVRGKDIKTRLKKLLDGEYRNLEKQVLVDVMRLPTNLHPDTPDYDTVLAEFGQKPAFAFDTLNHVELAKRSNSLAFRRVSDGAYYLLNDLALLEHHLANALTDQLRTVGLTQMICPDWVKSEFAHGCGVAQLHNYISLESSISAPMSPSASGHLSSDGTSSSPIKHTSGTSSELISNDAQQLLLTGISPLTFAAYLSLMNVSDRCLPVKSFSVGRAYSNDYQKDIGLYGVPQYTTCDVFGAVADEKSANDVFEELVQHFLSIYKSINLPCTFVRVGCKRLKAAESRRIDVYIWSSGYKQYFKCGQLSYYNDFIGRRLTMKHSTNINNTHSLNYLHMLHGTVMRIPSILASLTEHNQSQDGSYRIESEQVPLKMKK